MPNRFRLSLIAALVLIGPLHVGAVHADESADNATLNEPSWLDNLRNTCAQQYSVEQCQDEEFLEQNFHAKDLAAAHRAALRRQGLEQRALHELLLQRTCGNTAAYCTINATPDCAVQLQQMCAAAQQQAANCQNDAALYCATTGQSSDCLVQRRALCPTTKRQSIDKLLAKYPKLSLQQQIHVRQVAQQMDANDSTWIGNLFRWLGL